MLSTGVTDVNSVINFEAEYGLQGKVNDNRLYVRTYNNTSKMLYTYTTLTYLYTNKVFEVALPSEFPKYE